MPIIVLSKNPGLMQVAETAPPAWPRFQLGEVTPDDQTAVVLCEERTFQCLDYIRGKKICVVFDSVRQPAGFLKRLGVPVFTLDAPAEGAEWLFTPVAENYFSEEKRRDIPALFIGRTRYRRLTVPLLEQAGVTVISTDPPKQLPYAEYTNYLKRARCVVNLCYDRVSGRPHVKGRVFEALHAGAVLLEQKNDLTPKKLACNTFHVWETIPELREKIETAEIMTGLIGKKWAQDGLTASAFWNQIEAAA